MEGLESNEMRAEMPSFHLWHYPALCRGEEAKMPKNDEND